MPARLIRLPSYTFTYRMPDGSLRPDGAGHVALNDIEAFKVAGQTARDLATGVEKLVPATLIPVAIEVRDEDGWLVVTVPVVRR